MKTITNVCLYLTLFCLCTNLIRGEHNSPQPISQPSDSLERIYDKKTTLPRELRKNTPFSESSSYDNDDEDDNICFKFHKDCVRCVKHPSCYYCMNDHRCLHGSIVIHQLRNSLNITEELDGPFCRASAVCRYKEFMILLFSILGALMSFLIFCWAVYNFRKSKPNIHIDYM